MTSTVVPCAASSLLVGLLAADAVLVEVARTRVSVHYETGREDVPVLCVCEPGAVRLPNAMLAPVVPRGPVAVRGGGLLGAHATWRVHRWWHPSRPQGLVPPDRLVDVPGVEVPQVVRPSELVGAGPGLTPAGDDVLAGALVAEHATGDPRLARLRSETRVAMATRGTTAVSRGLLTHAMDGWAVPQLADFVTAACAGAAAEAAPALLAVGNSSGAALAAGVLHVLATSSCARGAA